MVRHPKHPGTKSLLFMMMGLTMGCEGGPTASRFPTETEISGLSLEADASIVDRAPDLLEIHLSVRNIGVQTITVLHGECPIEELMLYRAGGSEIPAWREGGLCFLPAYSALLAPNDSMPHRGQFAPRWIVDFVLGDSLPDGLYEAVVRVRFHITRRGEAEVEEDIDVTLSAGNVTLTRDQPLLPRTRTLDDIRWTADSRVIDSTRFEVRLRIENLGNDEKWIPWQLGCPMDVWIYSSPSYRDAAWRNLPFRIWPIERRCDPPSLTLSPQETRTIADTIPVESALWGVQPEGTWYLAVVHPVILSAGSLTLGPAP